jgi:hypothetical protein
MPLVFLAQTILDHTLKITILPRFKPRFLFYHASGSKKMKLNGGGIVNVGSMWAKQAVKATFFSLFYAKKQVHFYTALSYGISGYSCECCLRQ